MNSHRHDHKNSFLGKKKKKTTVITRSFFKKFSHVEDALSLLDIIFNSPESFDLVKGEEGMYESGKVLEAITDQNPELSYLDENHLAELFLRDPEGLLRVEYDTVGRRTDNFVKPPEVLYFGTTERYKDDMRKRGIVSKSKGFVRLFEYEEDALSFSKRFEGEGCTLLIDAKSAYSRGITFSASGREGEYLTTMISPIYIIHED